MQQGSDVHVADIYSANVTDSPSTCYLIHGFLCMYVYVASAIAANRWYHNDIIAHWGYVLRGLEQDEEIRRRHQMSVCQ